MLELPRPARNGGLFFCESAMKKAASELARHLGRQAEAVCRHYLSNGQRRAITGRWAMPATRRGAPCSSVYAIRRKAKPANGPMPPPANMATCSISSGRAAAWSTSRTSPMRRGLSSPCRRANPIRRPRGHVAHWRPDRHKRRAASLPCRGRSRARSQNHISAIVELRFCTEPAHCVSIRAATTGPTTMRRPRPGRR